MNLFSLVACGLGHAQEEKICATMQTEAEKRLGQPSEVVMMELQLQLSLKIGTGSSKPNEVQTHGNSAEYLQPARQLLPELVKEAQQ